MATMTIDCLPTLFLDRLTRSLDAKDAAALGDVSRAIRTVAAPLMDQRRAAYLSRFWHPGTQWKFRDMWSLPYEITQALPEKDKPVLYKRVDGRGYPFEKAVVELAEAKRRGDTGTFQLGWTALTRRMPWNFIWSQWDAYPWCVHGLTSHRELDAHWEDVLDHPERVSFVSLSRNHPDAIQLALKYPELPWETRFMGESHVRRHTDMTVDTMKALGIRPGWWAYDLACITVEDMLAHPEMGWDAYSVSRHPGLNLDILRRFPEGPQPKGWHPQAVTLAVPLTEILSNMDAFPWDVDILAHRQRDQRQCEATAADILADIDGDWDWHTMAEYRTIEDIFLLWDDPEAKQRLLIAYAENDDDEGGRDYHPESVGKYLSYRKDLPWDVVAARAQDTELGWNWSELSKKVPWDFVEQNMDLPWDMYQLSRRTDLTWPRLQRMLTALDWKWEPLSYNDGVLAE